jgi:hypothetical protein
VIDDPRALVALMHERPTRLVYEFAGAGSSALAWVRSVGGSSRTLLEATDRYAPRSLQEVIGAAGAGGPAVAAAVAAKLAEHARDRARGLADPAVPVAGVGVTATIATDRAKRGEHRVWVAYCSLLGTRLQGVTLQKGRRDRDGEERIVALLALRMMAEAKGVLVQVKLDLHDDEPLHDELLGHPAWRDFWLGARAMLPLDPLGRPCDALPWAGAGGSQAHGATGGAVVGGAFNPLHAGHLGMADAARRHLQRPLAFELSVVNADKPDLEALEVFRRAQQFIGHAPLILTRAPRFDQKAALLPESVFVLGADTAARVLEERFYPPAGGLRASLARVRAHAGRFLVAGRRDAHGFMTLADLPIPDADRDLFEALPSEAFRADVSSSAIRAAWDRGVAAPPLPALETGD